MTVTLEQLYRKTIRTGRSSISQPALPLETPEPPAPGASASSSAAAPRRTRPA